MSSKKRRNKKTTVVDDRPRRGPPVATELAASIRYHIVRDQVRADLAQHPEKGDRFAPPEKLA